MALAQLKDRLVPKHEVLVYLGISEPTFYRYAESGVLPVVRVGNALKVRESVVRSVMENGLPLHQEKP